MQPNYYNNQRNNLKRIILVIAIIIAIFIVIVIIAAFISGSNNSTAINNTATDSEPTPYGTEVVTPFYTPTREPTKVPSNTTSNAATQEPKPISTTVPLSQDKVYKKGDEGDEILLIQKMLIEIGFDPGKADGDFGNNLKSAVKNFQLYENLDDDGIIGPSTISLLISNWQEMMPKDLSSDQKLKGLVIGIDAGHQRNKNTSTEPVSPGSSKTREKASTGTYGRWTDAKEYVINLQIALRVKIELEALGATVIMTRDTHDVDISNSERAKIMNNANVDCWLRIYSNGNDDKNKKGILMLVPKDGCMDTTDTKVYEKSNKLSEILLSSALQATGANNQGTLKVDNLAGFNWSKVPVCLIEVGYLTNKTEDKLLVTKAYQEKIVNGLVNGFVEYFKGN